MKRRRPWSIKMGGSGPSYLRSRAGKLVMVAAIALVSGCVTAKAQGDHALERGDYEIALRFYEEALQEGPRDWEVYYRAAIAAQHQGAFAEAERYFSQSLRYGGDREVAIALGEFYVQTSNFIEAVRVYQHLLRFEENVQPVYSNIGTSLMYAGKYIDAESYLLLAQQMDPADPVPYLNLGVLYDHHIRNRPRSTRFYECFLELNKHESQEARQVQTRLREFELEGGADLSRVNLECGKIFRPGVPEHQDLQKIFDLEFGGSHSEEAGEQGEIIIERLDRGASEKQESKQVAPESQRVAVDELRARGEEQMRAGHFDRAAESMAQISPAERSVEDEHVLGQALSQIGKFSEAAKSFEVVLEAGPTPQVVETLVQLYKKLERDEERQRLCARFDGWPEFEEALRGCTDGLDP